MKGFLLFFVGLITLVRPLAARTEAGAYRLNFTDGRVYRIIYSYEVSPDPPWEKLVTASGYALFEDAAGNRVRVTCARNANRSVLNVFWSPQSKDRIEIRTDLGYGPERRPGPVTATINGRRYEAIIAPSGSSDVADFRKKLSPEVSGLSEGFRNGLLALRGVDICPGGTTFHYLFGPPVTPSSGYMESKTPMSERERVKFQAYFSAR